LHADPIEVDFEKEKKAPHFKPMWVRWLAVFVCISVGVTAASSNAKWREAIASFEQQKEQWEKTFENLPYCGELERPRRFMSDWFDRVKDGNHTCEDKHRSGRPRLVPPKVAERAAALVKKGRWVEVKTKKGTHHRLVYFTSIQDAVDHIPELQSILADHSITVAQLRAAMHDADPDLVRRRITFKRALSKEEKAERVATAKGLIERHAGDPSLLQNMIFIDETTIVLQGGNHEAVAVWCDKHDVNFNDVCPLPVGHKSEPTKVHIIAAVSAHPAFESTNGLVYVEFTTGTSHIKRRHNKRMDGSTRVTDYNYQVGGVAVLLHCSEHRDSSIHSCMTQLLMPRQASV
jgi:hypothetical protein